MPSCSYCEYPGCSHRRINCEIKCQNRNSERKDSWEEQIKQKHPRFCPGNAKKIFICICHFKDGQVTASVGSTGPSTPEASSDVCVTGREESIEFEDLKKKFDELKMENDRLKLQNQMLEANLSKFTPSQIQLLMGLKVKKFDMETIITAINIRGGIGRNNYE